MAPFISLLQPKQLVLAGVLAGAVSVLPAAATFGKGRGRQALPRPAALFVSAPEAPAPLLPPPPPPSPAPPPVALEPLLPPTDALFYDIPPRYMDPALLAEAKCDSAATAGETPGKVAIDFSGYVVWQNGRFPQHLPTATFLTIELLDASTESIEDRPLLYVHTQEVSEVYQEGEPIQYKFCAKVPEVEHYGLYARVVSSAVQHTPPASSTEPVPQLSFAGLTDVEAGLKQYKNMRVLLFNAAPPPLEMQPAPEKEEAPAEGTEDVVTGNPLEEEMQPADDEVSQRSAGTSVPPAPAGAGASTLVPSASAKIVPSAGLEVCNFSEMQPGLRGVGANVILEVPPPLASVSALPSPTILTVLLEEMRGQAVLGEALSESEPLAVFSSDIAQYYTAGEPLTAMLCAQIPAESREAEVTYRLRSLLNIGWDGYVEGSTEEAAGETETQGPLQQLRNGDFVAETTLTVAPEKDFYIVQPPLVQYEA